MVCQPHDVCKASTLQNVCVGFGLPLGGSCICGPQVDSWAFLKLGRFPHEVLTSAGNSELHTFDNLILCMCHVSSSDSCCGAPVYPQGVYVPLKSWGFHGKFA